jgi:hypothetical protein
VPAACVFARTTTGKAKVAATIKPVIRDFAFILNSAQIFQRARKP